MPALAQSFDEDLQSRAANDDDINGGSGTRTKYAYVNNNPLTFTDPTGFCGTFLVPTNYYHENSYDGGNTWGSPIYDYTFYTSISTPCGGGGSGSSGSQGQSSGGGSAGGANVNGSKTSKNPCNSALIDAGNALIGPANNLADISIDFGTIGLATAGLGILAKNPDAIGAGMATADTGAVAGYAASGLQITAGLLQSAGGARNDNARNAFLTLGAGALLSNYIKGMAPTGNSYSQRLAQAYVQRVEANVGYLYGLVTNFVKSLGPQTARCSAPAPATPAPANPSN